MRTYSSGAGENCALPPSCGCWGGLALAGIPPFATFLGESLVSGAGKTIGYKWVACVFIVSGEFTGGAVFRVGMRTFTGRGDQGPWDRSSEIDELPEDPEENRIIYWFLFTPAAICILGCMAICFVPHLRKTLELAAMRVLNQSAYIQLVYTGRWVQHVSTPALPPLFGPSCGGRPQRSLRCSSPWHRSFTARCPGRSLAIPC